MPYTKSSANLPKNVKKLPEGERDKWAKTWNSAYESCRKKGGDQKTCESRAFGIANGNLKEGAAKTTGKQTTQTSPDSELAVPSTNLHEARGQGRGVGKPAQQDGGTGVCVCPKCKTEVKHKRGTPCVESKCPKCGAAMVGKEKEGGNVTESIQAKVDELITESAARDVPAELDAKVKALIDESSGEKLEENFIERVDEVLVPLKEAATVKTDDGAKFPASAFAYAPDPEKPSTWRLRLAEKGKGVTRKQLDRAAARFSEGGYSGKKADIPPDDVGMVKLNIREAYRSAGVDDKDISRWVKDEEPRALVGEIGCVEIEEATAERVADGVLPVRFLAPGFNSDKSYFYTERAIQDACRKFEGLKMYANHPTKSEDSERPERDMWSWVANLRNCRVSSSGNGVGDAIINDGRFKEKVQGLREAGELTELGVSIIGVGKGAKSKLSGVKTHMIEGIVTARSADFVTEPGAGGRAGLRESIAVQGVDPENDVDLLDEAGLRERRADLVAIIEASHEKTLRKEIEVIDELKEKLTELDGQVVTLTEERDGLKGQLEEAERKERVVTAQAEIAKLVDEADLHESSKAWVREEFAEADSVEGVAEALERHKTHEASLGEAGVIRDMGGSDNAADSEKSRADLLERKTQQYIDDGETKEDAERMARAYFKG